eukprot:4430758-Ditylum_brightwellii.AAC.1
MEKFGSWVSKNWMGLGRTSKWAFSNLDEIVPGIEFNFPSKPMNQRTSKENKSWLRFYGLPTHGLAIEKRHHIFENKDKPDLKTPEECTGSTDNVENVI